MRAQQRSLDGVVALFAIHNRLEPLLTMWLMMARPSDLYESDVCGFRIKRSPEGG
jgi:hypothetical protein